MNTRKKKTTLAAMPERDTTAEHDAAVSFWARRIIARNADRYAERANSMAAAATTATDYRAAKEAHEAAREAYAIAGIISAKRRHTRAACEMGRLARTTKTKA